MKETAAVNHCRNCLYFSSHAPILIWLSKFTSRCTFSNRLRHFFSRHARSTFIIVKKLCVLKFRQYWSTDEKFIINKSLQKTSFSACFAEKKIVTETEKVMFYVEYWVKLKSFSENF
jgi:hypothetical protein